MVDLSKWIAGLEWSGSLEVDLAGLLAHHGKDHTLAHVRAVASEAQGLARRFGADPDAAFQAGLLHDVSAVIPAPQRLQMARLWKVPILPEEESLPVLLHQKLSAVMAAGLFAVRDPAILSAVGCHTTLRPGAGRLDLLLFVADKVAWDQPGAPPYLEALLAGLEHSLERAAWVYLADLQRRLPRPLHPWARAALAELAPEGC